MGCDYPLRAFRTRPDADGKRGVVFTWKGADTNQDPFELPCGSCQGCRLDRSRDFAVRMMHEAEMHPYNCFLTLTYSNLTVPQDYGLCIPHVQRFMKRYRKHVHTTYKKGRIKFYAAGEYGDTKGRPHYHLCIFGHDFPDKKPSFKNERGEQLYTSDQLDELWSEKGVNLGGASVGALTFDSAAYVARYCMKKVNGPKADDHYARVSPIDGQAYNVQPEFATQSNGLGLTWFKKYRGDVFPSGFIVANGVPQPPPRYYKLKLEEFEKEQLADQAWHAGLSRRHNNTKERRKVRAEVRDLRLSQRKRDLGEKL